MIDNKFLDLLVESNKTLLDEIKQVTNSSEYIVLDNAQKDRLLKKIGKKYDVDMMFLPMSNYDLINLMKVTEPTFYGIELNISKKGELNYPSFLIRNNDAGSSISIGIDYLLLKQADIMMNFNLEKKTLQYTSSVEERSDILNKHSEIFNNNFDSILNAVMNNQDLPEDVRSFISILSDEDVSTPVRVKFEPFSIVKKETITERLKNRLFK